MSGLKYFAACIINNVLAESSESVGETENDCSKQNVPRQKAFGANWTEFSPWHVFSVCIDKSNDMERDPNFSENSSE